MTNWQDVPCKLTTWWTGKDGYGRRYIRGSHGEYDKAHRFALEEKLGRPIKPGMEALHHCDNPPCIEPSHLFEGTQADNMHDMLAKGRSPFIGVSVRPECGTSAGWQFHRRRNEECEVCHAAYCANLHDYRETRKLLENGVMA